MRGPASEGGPFSGRLCRTSESFSNIISCKSISSVYSITYVFLCLHFKISGPLCD